MLCVIQKLQIRMKGTKNVEYILLFHIAIMISLSTSCTYRNSNNINNLIVLTDNDNVKTVEKELDSSIQLRYTSMILSIFDDSQGNFWFGSSLEGVCRYDGKSFKYFTIQDGLSDNQIRTIQEDVHGNIWFGTGNGICRYDSKNHTIYAEQELENLRRDSETKWQNTANDVWIGNGDREGGIYRYDGKNLTYLKFPVLDRNHNSFSIPGPVIEISESNNLWIASYWGVLGFDGKSFIFINERELDYHIRSIFEDSKSNIWIGNNGIGVLCYDGVSTINFTEKHGLYDKKSIRGGIISPKGTLNHVFSIGEDRNGNIWFGDRDSGLWLYDGNSMINYTNKNGLSSMFVRTIYTDSRGEIWFGLDDGSVCQFNGESFDRIY